MAIRLIAASPVFVAAFALGCILYLYAGAEALPVFLNLSSPDGAYRIELNEHVETRKHWAPLRAFFSDPRAYNELRFSAFRGTEPLAQNVGLWNDPSSNQRFFEIFKYEWVNDSVFRFGSDLSTREARMDNVTVYNDTSEAIDELRVNARDTFLVLDLQPKTAKRFSAPPQSSSSWLNCQGRFESGAPISIVGEEFYLHDNEENHVPKHYCVAITDNGVLIQSAEAEGYRTENNGKVTIPKGNLCETTTKRL